LADGGDLGGGEAGGAGVAWGAEEVRGGVGAELRVFDYAVFDAVDAVALGEDVGVD